MSDPGKKIDRLPCWSGPVSWEPLKGGLSNESFVASDKSEKFVVRFGRDFPFHHVSREREIMATRAAHAAGFAPELIYSEPGIMVSRFIDAKTYDADDVRNNVARVADIMKRFHTTMANHVSGPGFIFWVFHVIRDYANTLKEGGSRMTENLSGYVELAQELEAAQELLPIIYGHHDLLPANLMDDGDKLWLIDFEYAGFSTAMFDLAGIASNAEFDETLSDELLERYFANSVDPGLKKSHSAMQCASLLREAMWSMVSELHLETPGVDYVAYTSENLERLEVALDAYRSTYGQG